VIFLGSHHSSAFVPSVLGVQMSERQTEKKSPIWSSVYQPADFIAMRKALKLEKVATIDLVRHSTAFNRAAFWFKSMRDYRDRRPDRSVVDRLDAIANSAYRATRHGCILLRHKRMALPSDCSDWNFNSPAYRPGSYGKAVRSLSKKLTIDPDAIEDGITDPRIANALVLETDHDDKDLKVLLSKLYEYGEDTRGSVAAALELYERAKAGVTALERVRDNLKRADDTSDAALSGWIDDMLSLYVEITKEDIKFSKVKDEEPNAGEPTGPLIRFLIAAGKPIGIELSPYSLARRIETAKEHHARKKQ
jgi:hypothetical protein